MAEPILWSLLAVNVAWLALNVWLTTMNNRQADDNLRQARETAALIEDARRIAGVKGCGAADQMVGPLRDALELLAAQASGTPGSTSRADCMAAIAAAALSASASSTGGVESED